MRFKSNLLEILLSMPALAVESPPGEIMTVASLFNHNSVCFAVQITQLPSAVSSFGLEYEVRRRVIQCL